MDRFAAMEAFIRVVDAGSFSGAAKQLRVGQPAVSKTIAQLEDRLAVRLLLRSTHRLTPTEAGRNFYERAKRAIEEALAEHPSLDIDVVLDDRDLDLVAAGIDVALLIGRLTDSALTVRKIGQCRRSVIGTPAYLAARGVPQTPADLLAHQAIVYEQRDGGATWVFRQGTSETTVTVSGRLRVSAGEGIRDGVLAGLGFAIGSEWLFTPELKSGAVQTVLTEWQLPHVDLWAVFPTGRQASAKARAFASFVESQMSISRFGASG